MKNIIHKIPNTPNMEKEESIKRRSDEDASPLYVERDVFGLEKQKTGPAQSAITPYKIFMGLLIVFLTLIVVYLITKVI